MSHLLKLWLIKVYKIVRLHRSTPYPPPKFCCFQIGLTKGSGHANPHYIHIDPTQESLIIYPVLTSCKILAERRCHQRVAVGFLVRSPHPRHQALWSWVQTHVGKEIANLSCKWRPPTIPQSRCIHLRRVGSFLLSMLLEQIFSLNSIYSTTGSNLF